MCHEIKTVAKSYLIRAHRNAKTKHLVSALFQKLNFPRARRVLTRIHARISGMMISRRRRQWRSAHLKNVPDILVALLVLRGCLVSTKYVLWSSHDWNQINFPAQARVFPAGWICGGPALLFATKTQNCRHLCLISRDRGRQPRVFLVRLHRVSPSSLNNLKVTYTISLSLQGGKPSNSLPWRAEADTGELPAFPEQQLFHCLCSPFCYHRRVWKARLENV